MLGWEAANRSPPTRSTATRGFPVSDHDPETPANVGGDRQPSRVAGSSVVAWGGFLLKRLGLLLGVVLVVTLLTFGVTRATGTPLYVAVGQQATQEMIDARAEAMGLNLPLWQQYSNYLQNLLQGNLGQSRRTFTPVAQDIAERLPATAELVTWSILLSLAWAVPLGIRAARKPRGAADRVGEGLAQFGVSVPGFWLGLLLIFAFYYLIPIFPAPLGRLGGVPPPPFVTGFFTIDALLVGEFETFATALRYLALPAITLSFTSAPPIFRVTRSSVAGALRSDFVAAARSYGIGPRVVMRRHVLRNAAPPVMNLVAMTFGYLIGGAVLIEVVFSWPGIGLYAVRAMDFSDYDAVLGVVLLSAVIYVAIYFVVDLLQYLLDPRLREAA
jgi:ABC-type dipeptide/oligopeptide/nickel transport system permease component